MRLFLISKPGCHHITELMNGIKAVYQLEMELNPYLLVEFLPNKNNDPGGVIIQAGDEIIRRNYTFDDPNDIKELRKLLWKYLRKLHDPVDITNKNGNIINFKKTQTNKVIQGWQNKKKLMKKDICCKIVRDMVAYHIYKSNSNKTPFKQQLIKHPVYRYDNRDLQDKRLCKQNRFRDCGDNYPPGSILFKRCIDEANFLCNKGYPRNTVRETTENYREQLKKYILKYLKDNDMKVNKQMLDLILSAGFFERVKGRAGNRAHDYNDLIKTVDKSLVDDFDYYANFIESFKNEHIDNSNNIFINILLVLSFIIAFLYVIYHFNYTQNRDRPIVELKDKIYVAFLFAYFIFIVYRLKN